MQTAEIEREIRDFLTKNYLFGRQEALQNDAALFGGILDSTGAIEFVMFLQDSFKITVEDDEVAVPENLGSIKHTVAFVEKKIKSRA